MQMLEKAKWIENRKCPKESAPLFRKRFILQQFDTAQIAICGLGFYTLAVNGKKVSDELLTPPFTAYDKRVLYQVYDIAQHLVPGENVIEVVCGNGWYNQQEADAWSFQSATWKANPKMICQVNVDGVCFLVSDSSWETAQSRTVFNSLRAGETYDAVKSVEAFLPANIARGPGGVLQQQTMPAVKLQGTFAGVEVFPNVYDFGRSITGNVQIKVRGACGQKIAIVYSERIFEDGTLDRNNIIEHVYSERFAEDVYVLKGEGEETWHGNFSFHGFRYAQLCYQEGVEVLSVTARDVHTDLQMIGDYRCDNEDINALHRSCVWALLTNYVHIPMDCPHREKNGWTADAMMSSFQAFYNLDMKAAYLKWLDDIVDCQRPNGAIPCIAPTSIWGYQWGSGVTWDAALFVLPWNLYRFTGDSAVLDRYYPAMERYLEFLDTQSDNDIFTIGLGDWCAPKEAERCEDKVVVTCYAKHVFDLFARISAVLGYEKQEAYAKSRSAQIKAAFCDAFSQKHAPSQTYYAALVYFDMTDEKQRAADRLAQLVQQADGHIHAGIFGAHMIPIVLRDNGHVELAWDMVCKEDYPGWLNMMHLCHGTMGEHWDGSSSLDHHMFTAVDSFIQETLSGMRAFAGDAGFKNIYLTPCFPKNVGQFSCWHDLREGKLEIRWDRQTYRVVIPEGITGAVVLGGKKYALQTGENIFRLDIG